MNGKDLANAFGYINDKYLDIADNSACRSAKQIDSASKQRKRISLSISAAVLCMLCAGAITFALSPYVRRLSSDNAVVAPSTSTDLSMSMTSERYGSLDELLTALSTNDGHSEKNADYEGRSLGTESDSFSNGSDHAVYGEYLYRADYDSGFTGVYLRSKNGTERVAHIDLAADSLFICDKMLIIVGSYMSGGTELDYEMSTEARIYSLADPANPSLIYKYIQLGSLTSCHMADGRLYLLTSDGECACGWSRLEDKSAYMPAISYNDQSIIWEDSEISILGEPANVHYSAVSVIDIRTSSIICKHAFYGDIDKLWLNDGWIAFSVFTSGSNIITHPELYTFEITDRFSYTGKLSCAAVLELAPKVLFAATLPNGIYPSIKSVIKSGDEYRIIGELVTVNGEKNSYALLTVTASMTSGQHEHCIFELSGIDYAVIDEILWENDRALISYAYIANRDAALNYENRLVFADFTDGLQYYQNDLILDHVAGVDGIYYYGCPFGELNSFIPLGNGIYLRYNETPDRFDIYDFSDSRKPVCLYRSCGDIPTGCRFDFISHVYDETTFGVVMITPDENGDYRKAAYTWCIYSVDISSNEPLNLINETPWEQGFDPLSAISQ